MIRICCFPHHDITVAAYYATFSRTCCGHQAESPVCLEHGNALRASLAATKPSQCNQCREVTRVIVTALRSIPE